MSTDNAPIHEENGTPCGPMVTEDRDGWLLDRRTLRCFSCGRHITVSVETWEQARAADLAWEAKCNAQEAEVQP